MMCFQSFSRAHLLGLALTVALAGCAGVRQVDTGMSSPSSAELFVPYQFQVQAIDSTVLRDSFHTFDGRDQTLRVAPGEHELTLRYYDMIEDAGDRTDDYEKILSEPITVSFTAQANGRYAVVGERPTTPAAGKNYAAGPTLAIKNRSSGETVSGDVTVAEPEIETIRRGNTVYAPVGQSAPAASTAARDTMPAPAPANGPPQSFEMLKYWWNNASAAERERFETWRARSAD